MTKKKVEDDFGDIGEPVPEPAPVTHREPVFTAAQMEKTVKVQPKTAVIVEHKTAGDLMRQFPHSPASLAQSMADYLNAKSGDGFTVIGSLGDTTNHYFLFVHE